MQLTAEGKVTEVPESDNAVNAIVVVAGAGEDSSIRGEPNRPDSTAELKPADDLRLARVPQANHAVIVPGGDEAAAGGYCHAAHFGFMGIVVMEERLPRGEVQQADRFIAALECDGLAVRRKRDSGTSLPRCFFSTDCDGPAERFRGKVPDEEAVVMGGDQRSSIARQGKP